MKLGAFSKLILRVIAKLTHCARSVTDRKVSSACDLYATCKHLDKPVAVELLADLGLSHVEAATQRRLQTTAIQYRHPT